MSQHHTTTACTEETRALPTATPAPCRVHHWAVAPGDEHDRGVETLCIGEAA